MRKIFEIRKDLSAKIAEVKALDPKQNAEAVEKGLKEIEALRKELEQAQQIEAAEQLAADEQFNQMQKNASFPAKRALPAWRRRPRSWALRNTSAWACLSLAPLSLPLTCALPLGRMPEPPQTAETWRKLCLTAT